MKNNKLLKIIIYTTSLIAALLGILALIGWFTGSTSLIKINTSFVSMQFHTALSFLLSGVGLFCLVNNNLLIGKIAIILVGIISFFTIIEYLSGLNIGFYEIFINHNLKNQTLHPNQIVLNTALPFLFFSIATVLSTSTKRYKIFIGLISSLVFSIGLIGLASYITRDGFNYGWGYFFQMSVQSTFGFIALGIGITALTTLFGTRKKNVYSWIIGYAIGLTITLFLIDISLPLQVSGISYVLLIILGWFIPKKKITLILALIATFFLTLGYLVVKKENIPGFNIFHLLLELIILWIVSTLLYNIKKKEIVLKDINKKLKIAKIKIEKREAEFSAITNQSTEGITVADLDGNYIFVNPAFCIMSGYSKEELLKMTVFDMKAKNQSHSSFYESMGKMEGKPITVTLQRKDKTEYLSEIVGKNIIIGKEHLVLGTIRDITELKETEKKLLKSEFRLTQAQKVANIGYYSLDIKSMTWTSSDFLNTLFGIDKFYIKDFKEWVKIIHKEDNKHMRAYFKKNIMKNHEIFNKEYRIVNPNTKEIKWIHNLGELEYDNNGTVIKINGTIQDITKRKKTDKILMENERRLSSIYNTVGDVIFYLDIKNDGVYVFNSVNNSFCQTIGISEDKVIGKLVNEVIPEPSLSLALKKYQEAINKKIIVQWEETTNYPKGELTGVVSIAPIFDAHGHCTNLVGSVHDITERKKTELVIKENEELLNITGEIAKVGGWELDLISNKLKWTQETKRIHEVDKDYLPDLATAINFYHPDYREMVSNLVSKAIEDGKGFTFEARIITATDNQKWVRSLAKTVIKDGKCIRVYGSFQDITDYKNIEKKLEEYHKQLEIENVFLKEEISLSFNYQDMVYSSIEISDVLTQVEQVSSTDATVLILGETGTGKELIAKAVHNTSNRKNKPLIRVNCAAIPTELIESELFGHIKGSFTGAIRNRIGKFELADGGSLFLDEIGEMPLKLQPKLLRAIQEGEIEPIGSSKIKKLDVRIIAATNKDLKKEVENKRFREDLYFRLNVFPITIPPLRKRIEDIPVLIEHFVNKFCVKHGKDIKYISDIAVQQMKTYSWPGNVRELENLIERAVIISNIDIDYLELKEFDQSQSTHQKKAPIKNYKNSLEEVQRNHILKILNKTQWKISGKEGAAELLDIKPSTLRDRMKKLGIHRPKK